MYILRVKVEKLIAGGCVVIELQIYFIHGMSGILMEFGLIMLLEMIILFLYRFMEMKNGHLGFVNKVLEYLVVLQQRTQCTHSVKALFLEKHPSLTRRSIKL